MRETRKNLENNVGIPINSITAVTSNQIGNDNLSKTRMQSFRNRFPSFTTANGKRMKKCSTSGWDREAKKATGCDYVEWINGTTEKLDEKCPQCGEPLVLFTTAAGKRMKKCSTSGWDREAKRATGCPYVEWLEGNFSAPAANGEEFLPPEDIF